MFNRLKNRQTNFYLPVIFMDTCLIFIKKINRLALLFIQIIFSVMLFLSKQAEKSTCKAVRFVI